MELNVYTKMLHYYAPQVWNLMHIVLNSMHACVEIAQIYNIFPKNAYTKFYKGDKKCNIRTGNPQIVILHPSIDWATQKIIK